MHDFEVRFHPDFFKDLDKLDKRDVEIVDKQLCRKPMRKAAGA